MAILDDVRKLIARLSPQAIRDDCITERLGLSTRQHANQETRELAGTGVSNGGGIRAALPEREARHPQDLMPDMRGAMPGDPLLPLARGTSRLPRHLWT